MTRASLAAFKQSVTVSFPRQVQADAKKFLVKIALAENRRVLDDQRARSGGVPEVEAYANRVGNRDLNSVVLPGPIVFNYFYLREIVSAALDALRKLSPARSGLYRESHSLFIDGVPVAALPARLPKGAEIMISNPVPYARKIEIGKTKAGRKFVIQVDDRIYERVGKALGLRYRAIADINFTYATLPGAATIKGRSQGKPSPDGQAKRQQKIGAVIRSPAIVIKNLL